MTTDCPVRLATLLVLASPCTGECCWNKEFRYMFGYFNYYAYTRSSVTLRQHFPKQPSDEGRADIVRLRKD